MNEVVWINISDTSTWLGYTKKDADTRGWYTVQILGHGRQVTQMVRRMQMHEFFDNMHLQDKKATTKTLSYPAALDESTRIEELASAVY